MKHVRLLALALSLLLLCAACGRGGEEGEYLLYFTVNETHGPALDTQPYGGAGDPDPGQLLTALLAGPQREGLTSPFTKGVALQSWELDPEEPGKLRVRLSEPYSGLADISLTLADYCIVLTLTQLPEVESVEILSEGHTASYRSHQVLTAAEALLPEKSGG